MPERIEIRNGREYRVRVLPDAVPPPWRNQTSRYQLRDVGKHPDAPKGKSIAPGIVPDQNNAPPRAPKQHDAPVVHPETKYPFAATISGESVTVWPDWIERMDA